MVEKISVQIALEGTEEIKRQLAGVSEAGQKAFADISAAAAKTGGFDKLDPTLVAQKLSEFGVTTAAEINKITAALQAAGKTETVVTGVQKLEQGVTKLATSAGKATAAFGLTRGQISALGKALREADLGVVGSQLGVIGRVGGAFGTTGIAITAAAGAIVALTAGMIKFATSASETEQALTQLQKVTGQSFENLSVLQQVFAAGGTSAKTFANEMSGVALKVADVVAEVKAQNALVMFGPKQGKELIDWANDIDAISRSFDHMGEALLAAGTLITNGLTTVDNKAKAVILSLSRVKDPDEQWLRLADIFKNLGSDLERVQLGQKLGLSPTTINTLSQGREKMQQLQAEVRALGLTLTTDNQAALQQLAAGWFQLSSIISAAWQKIGAAAAPAFARILAIAKEAIAGIVQDFQNMPLDQALANLGNRLAPLFQQLSTILSPIVIQIGTTLGNALIDAMISAIINTWAPAWQKFQNELLQNWFLLQEKLGITPSGSQPRSGSGGGMASGGLIGGRGTGTSDSNLAWVSRGEHIMPARAVAQPGVLAFLEALRRSGGDLSRVLDGMGRFALGGLVPGPIPSFAGGGLVSGMHPVTIAFPGVPAITGLRASSAVVDELRKSAALAQVRSGGRKPSRYS
jgi:hypothetical protein